MVPYTRPIPPEPFIDKEIANFFAYIKKRGNCVKESDCIMFCEKNQLDLDSIILQYGYSKIMKGKIPKKGQNNLHVCIMDKNWANARAICHDVEIPHHRHYKSIE